MVSACSKHEGWWQGSRNIWDGCVRKGIRCDHLCHVQVTKVTPLRIRKEKKETYHVMLKCCQQCRFWSFVPQSWLLSCKYGSDKRSQGAVLQPPHLPQRAARDQAEEHSVHPGQPVHLWLLLSGGCWDCSANCHQGWSGRKKKIPDKNCSKISEYDSWLPLRGGDVCDSVCMCACHHSVCKRDSLKSLDCVFVKLCGGWGHANDPRQLSSIKVFKVNLVIHWWTAIIPTGVVCFVNISKVLYKMTFDLWPLL